MNSYNERTHIIGRFWIITALFAFLMIPVAISLKLNAFPQASVVLKGLAPIAMLFYPTAVIEVCTYSPMLGSGATYIAFVTGNINNLKSPCALSAMDSAGVSPNSDEGEILSTIAVAASSIVTTLIIAVGVIAFAPFLPRITAPDSVLAPAFRQVVPALFGALGMSYIAKHFKISIVPIAVICLMLRSLRAIWLLGCLFPWALSFLCLRRILCLKRLG